MKNKILFVNAILENNTPRSIRTLNFIKHLNNEYEIHILYFKFNKNKIEIPDVKIHVIEIKNLFRRKFIASKTKNIFPRLIYKIMNLPNKFKDIFYFDIKNLSVEIKKLDSMFKFTKIVISVSPFSLYKIADHISFDKVVFDIGDPLYKNSVLKNSHDNYYYQSEKKALEKSKNIIVTNLDTKNHFISSYELPPDKIEIISQGFDKELVDEIKNKKVANKEVVNKIRLVYGGRFYEKLRNPTMLIEAIQKFNSYDNESKIQFDIYGGQGIKISEGDGVSVHPAIDQKELFNQIVLSDYNVFIDNYYGIQTPGKIYENLALSTPILYLKSPEVTKTFEFVKNCQGIIFVENIFDEIIVKLLQLKVEDHKIKCDFDLSKYSWKNISLKVINLNK